MAGPSPFTVPTEAARAAFDESVTSFVGAVDALTEWDLLGASRCHGWARLDVVVHVLGGWQEVLAGMVSPTDDEPTVDAATYWTAFAATDETALDPVGVLLAQRRRGAAYARPAAAVGQLHDVADAVRRGAAGLADRAHAWQGQVLTAGDFLATWAVEDVVHQLDLDVASPVPSSGLALVRGTAEALLGEPLPSGWDDERAALVVTGRLPLPDGAPGLAGRVPVLG